MNFLLYALYRLSCESYCGAIQFLMLNIVLMEVEYTNSDLSIPIYK